MNFVAFSQADSLEDHESDNQASPNQVWHKHACNNVHRKEVAHEAERDQNEENRGNPQEWRPFLHRFGGQNEESEGVLVSVGELKTNEVGNLPV